MCIPFGLTTHVAYNGHSIQSQYNPSLHEILYCVEHTEAGKLSKIEKLILILTVFRVTNIELSIL
jgi:hypothetical protein